MESKIKAWKYYNFDNCRLYWFVLQIVRFFLKDVIAFKILVKKVKLKLFDTCHVTHTWWACNDAIFNPRRPKSSNSMKRGVLLCLTCPVCAFTIFYVRGSLITHRQLIGFLWISYVLKILQLAASLYTDCSLLEG